MTFYNKTKPNQTPKTSVTALVLINKLSCNLYCMYNKFKREMPGNSFFIMTDGTFKRLVYNYVSYVIFAHL